MTSDQTRGQTVAAILAGSWRPLADPWTLGPDRLAGVVPILSQTSAAGLAWRRVQAGPALEVPGLKAAAQLMALANRQVENDLVEVVALLQEHGIHPLLAKGWSSALPYAERGLRPLGDIDLCVEPAQYEAARRLVEPGPRDTPVDLHRGLVNEQGVALDVLSFETLHARGRDMALQGVPLRVMSPEDQLRVMAVHMLRHGVSRPVWLCDVAAALEAVQEDFDWRRCLEPLGARLDWLESAAGLARDLLHARLPAGPLHARHEPWLQPAVERRWGRPVRSIGLAWESVWEDVQTLYDRLSDPLWALRSWDGSLQTFPPWRLQLRHLAQRTRDTVRLTRPQG